MPLTRPLCTRISSDAVRVAVLPLALLLGCRPDPTSIQDITATVSPEVGTVVRIQWTTEEPTDGRVDIESDDKGADSRTESGDATTAHNVLLFGLSADTTYRYTVTSTLDGESVASDELTFTTAALPSDLPAITQAVGPSPAGGFEAVGLNGEQGKPAIVSADGEFVWWWIPECADCLVTRVKRSLDGKAVVFAVYPHPDGTTVAEIYRVSYDGSLVERTVTEGLNHDFLELPEGGYAYIADETRMLVREDGSELPVQGHDLMEVTRDGVVSMIWSSWDSYVWDEHVDYGEATDWEHANALRLDEAGDAYYVGLRNFNSIIRVGRASGEIEWELGGEQSMFELTAGTPFEAQHSFEMYEDELIVFDNRAAIADASRAVRYSLDRSAMTYAETWSFSSADEYHTAALGDVHLLPDGNVRTIWSTNSEINEVTESGELVWQVNLDAGSAFGFGDWSEDPAVEP